MHPEEPVTFPSLKLAVIVVFGSVLFTPVSVASDASVHVVPSSCKAGVDVIVAFGEGVTLLDRKSVV